MIHALELENFKGVGARTRIEFAPITLLFGANNVGKSTVLHSLAFVHEILKHGSADVDRTELGHESLELGGFARIVVEVSFEMGMHGTWRCAACNRPLGYAGSGALGIDTPWPQGRRPKPSEPPYHLIDIKVRS